MAGPGDKVSCTEDQDHFLAPKSNYLISGVTGSTPKSASREQLQGIPQLLAAINGQFLSSTHT